jgi:2-octaprenyl-6-methoxyphenol hydroxylase
LDCHRDIDATEFLEALMTNSEAADFDVAVIGAGPAGLIAGLAMAEMGFATAIIGPPADPRDGRTAALFQASVMLLKRLGAWENVAVATERLDAIRLVDATGALFRAPEVTFYAHEIGEAAFGYNVPNAVLAAALEQLAATRVRRIVTGAVTQILPAADRVTLTTADGERFACRLAAAADGRQSPSRAAAGITPKRWTYDQGAVVCTLGHSRPHNRISTEFHRRCGPLTVVPAPGNTCNLVWVDTLSEAERLAALDDTAFVVELSRHLQGLLGQLTLHSPRRMFPLSGQTAEPMAQNRIALIGEAGHVIPPIGAQGLNLSFRDAATLAEVAAAARDGGEDIGGVVAMARYATARRFDVTSRIRTVDLLNRSLLSEYAPIHLLRGLGLFALSTLPPLRRRVMREGMAPPQSTPKLMQPVA